MTGADDVDAIVLAAGRGERLGLGPKAWLSLGGRTLLERAVATARRVAGRVFVGAAADDLEQARTVCGEGAIVVSGGATHRDTMLAALGAGRAPIVLVHDVAHPFVTPALAQEVIDAARQRGAAVAAVVSASSAYRWAAGAAPVRLPPGEVWTVRRPFVFPRAEFARGLEMEGREAGLSTILGRAGVTTALVRSPSWNIKVTTPDDWTLAAAVEQTLRPV